MGLPHGPSQFVHSFFVGLVLVSLCDTKVSLSRKGCGGPGLPVHGRPKCQLPLCKEPLDAGVFKPGTLMEFDCESGYNLVGLPALAVCQGGDWHMVRELVCKPHGTPPPSTLIVAFSVPVVITAAVTFLALVMAITACMMLMPRRSVCCCTKPAGSVYETMEYLEEVGPMDGDRLDNGMGPLPSYEEAVCGHLGTSLPRGGHNSGPLFFPELVVSCHKPCGLSQGELTCLRGLPSYQEALVGTAPTEGRDVPEGEPHTRFMTQDLNPVLGMENIC